MPEETNTREVLAAHERRLDDHDQVLEDISTHLGKLSAAVGDFQVTMNTIAKAAEAAKKIGFAAVLILAGNADLAQKILGVN